MMNIQNQKLAKWIAQDLGKIPLVFSIACCLGLLINTLRDNPLPLVYQDKSERLASSVEKIAQAEHSKSSQSHSGQVAQLPPEISLERFKSIVDAQEIIVIDARPEIFHRFGHVPGAISLPRDEFETGFEVHQDRLSADKSQPLVIYCASSSCEDSKLISSALEQLGFTSLSIFKGGWSAWQAAGYPEETGN